MGKHAYLIKAHHQFGLLEKLLRLLDDERNDIYIHIGRDVVCDRERLMKCLEKSRLEFVTPVKESWGGYSQIRSELELFRAASKRYHQYYHLLSGVDLPLKTQDEIHQFFEDNNGYEFLYFCPQDFWKESSYKYEQYRFLQEKIGRAQSGLFWQVERLSLFFQRKIGIRRRVEGIEYCLGANWVSITHELIEYILLQEKKIRKLFRATLCGDEFFVHTVVWNSSFRHKVFSFADDYYACLRLIDWKRGNPYVWKIQDYDELMEAPHLFARKFDEKQDSAIIERICETVMNRQMEERK